MTLSAISFLAAAIVAAVAVYLNGDGRLVALAVGLVALGLFLAA